MMGKGRKRSRVSGTRTPPPMGAAEPATPTRPTTPPPTPTNTTPPTPTRTTSVHSGGMTREEKVLLELKIILSDLSRKVEEFRRNDSQQEEMTNNFECIY